MKVAEDKENLDLTNIERGTGFKKKVSSFARPLFLATWPSD
jgi:hypothetical protein